MMWGVVAKFTFSKNNVFVKRCGKLFARFGLLP